MRSAVRFRLPPELEAAAPPEARGLRRDPVRLLLVDRATGSVEHHRFHELPRLLEPGDLLVANDSRTLPASLLGHTAAGTPLEVRLAARERGGAGPGEEAGRHGPRERWAALVLGVPVGGGDPALVPTDARPPAPALAPGERLQFAAGLAATVLGRHEEAGPLVWLAFDLAGERLAQALHRAGRPVRYAYVPRPWPLHQYPTLFAAVPGSAEMASAGRPFTVQTLRDLRDRGSGWPPSACTPGCPPTATRSPTAATCPPSPTWCRRRPRPRWPPAGRPAAGWWPSGPPWSGRWRPPPPAGTGCGRGPG